MPLQLPAKSKWHAPGSTYHNVPLLGLFCELIMRMAVCESEGWYSFGTGRFHGGPLSPASISGVSSLSQPLGIPSGEPCLPWSVSFLLAGSYPTNIDDPASTAIWATCWVGDNSSDLPTSSKISASTFLLSISPGVGGTSQSGASMASTSSNVFIFRVFLPLLGCQFHSCNDGSKRKPANLKPEKLHKSHVVFVLNWLLHISKNFNTISAVLFTMLFSYNV